MKKLADYEGEDAILLWADLLEPITRICADPTIAEMWRAKSTPIAIAKEILKSHGNDAVEVMLRIDPTPVNGLNAVTRVVEVIMEISKSEELKGFFGKAEQTKTAVSKESFGVVTANTEGAEN